MKENMQQNQHLSSDLIKLTHQIGRETLAKYAADVDEKSRFPVESIQALKEAKLLSAYVSQSLGGMGLSLIEIAEICEILGHYCGSSAMIFAMHQIQVACITHHYNGSEFFTDYLKKLVAEQRLIASATTEIGVGGDLRTSICAVETNGKEFTVTKQAPVISYGIDADDLILTARKTPDAPKSDQVHVLLTKGQYQLDPIGGWDALGFRGTCSAGFTATGKGSVEQIIPTPFADILSQTMHPYAHITWASLWAGIASDAVNKARQFVKNEARKNLDMPPISAIRLGEVDSVLQTMRSNISVAAENYQNMLTVGDTDAFSNFGFGIHTNNLKISSSELIVDIVGKAMLICGISSYRNDSKLSLCRHIRDAYGAALMVNNDRIMLHNSTLLLMHSEKVTV
jgi:acyl-CoA dehydrogenase